MASCGSEHTDNMCIPSFSGISTDTEVLSVETTKGKLGGWEFIICWNSYNSAAHVLTTEGWRIQESWARGRRTALPVQTLREGFHSTSSI